MNALSLASIVTTGSSLISTTVHHIWNRKAVKGTPHADLTYHQGVNLLRDFLDLCTDHIVEDLQALTSKDIPVPPIIHLERIKIPKNFLDEAAERLIDQLGEDGVQQVGGGEWWQWREPENDFLRAEWVETKRHMEEKKLNPDQAETIVLYIHGGAFYFGSAETMRFQVQTWAKKLNARILTPSYRLAPQYPFPCALHDALASYLYILAAHPASRVLVLGDSAGGNLCLSLLVTLRDRGIPLPAGGILLSPWVDLTHSFPSILEENDRDYIPKHGFRHKPSVAWPPPAVEDLENLASKSNADSPSKQHVPTEQGEKGYTERPISISSGSTTPTAGDTVPPAPPATQPPSDHITFEIDGKMVTVKDQIHMYTVNSLIGHPLVSPINQGSLGGLCPLLITSGGAEVLRDEHTYVAHKAAHPKKYPPNPIYMNDKQREALEKWPPTKVKFQVFDHCCHVVTALNYTRPAKYMNRSIGTFGKWAIEHAKKQQSIDFKSDDSIASVASDNSSLHIVQSPTAISPSASAKEIEDAKLYEEPIGVIKKVSTDIGQFEHHMIRERIDAKGRVYRLRPPSSYPCLSIPPSEIGVVRPEPLNIWLEGQKTVDIKYGALRKKMQDKQLQALLKNNQEENLKERGERPPPSALYRRRYKDEIKPTPSRESGLPASLWARFAQKEPKEGNAEEGEGKNVSSSSVTL